MPYDVFYTKKKAFCDNFALILKFTGIKCKEIGQKINKNIKFSKIIISLRIPVKRVKSRDLDLYYLIKS